jgi:serine/threonine protein kinase
MLFEGSGDSRYILELHLDSNDGFEGVDWDNAIDMVFDRLDLKKLSMMDPGRYEVIGWEYVKNDEIVDLKIMDEEIELSEIGMDANILSKNELIISHDIVDYDGGKYYLKLLSCKPKDLFISEVKVLSMLDHPNIIKIKALVKNENDRIIGMMLPFSNMGTLEDNMKSEMRSVLYLQIKDAIEYSKRMGFEYTDIKPSNIVIHDNSAILIDFDGGTTKEWEKHTLEDIMGV